MIDHLKFFINGEWVDPLGSETIEVINPSDESVIGSISAGTKEDIDIAVAAAQEKKRYVREQLVIMKDKCVVCNRPSCDGTAHQCLRKEKKHYCFGCQAKSNGDNFHKQCKAGTVNTNKQSCPYCCLALDQEIPS